MAQAVETQFDTTVVAAFEAILAASDESYRTAKGQKFQRSEEPPAAFSRPVTRAHSEPRFTPADFHDP